MGIGLLKATEITSMHVGMVSSAVAEIIYVIVSAMMLQEPEITYTKFKM